MEFKYGEEWLQKKIDKEINQRILESISEDLNKIAPLDKITDCMHKFSQIQEAICTIELEYGMHPKKNIIGSDLVNL